MGIAEEIYDGGGAKPFTFETVGMIVEGEILQIRKKQLPKFGTDVPEVWDDGTPKYTPIVTIQTSLEEDAEDDGKRDVYLRSNAYTAFGKALREAWKRKPSDDDVCGSTLKIGFVGTEKSGKGQPRKLFRARITPRSAAGDAWDGDGGSKAEPPKKTTPAQPESEPEPPPVDW